MAQLSSTITGMHILLIHQAFAGLNDAGGTRHFELAQFLVEKGHRVTIIASQISYLSGKNRNKKPKWVIREEPQAGIVILKTYAYSGFHRSFIHRMLSFFTFMISSFYAGIRVKKVDLIWGTSPPIFQAWTAWLISWLKHVPFVLEIRDLWPAFAIAVGVLKNKILISLSEWLERFLYKNAERVIVNSPGFIEHIKQRGADKIDLIVNGVNPDMFNPSLDASAWRHEHLLEGKFVVMYAGAHGLSNDLGVVLKAAELLMNDPEVAFVLVGDGKDKPKLMEQAENLGLKNVTFLPSVAKSDMALTLAGCDAAIAILKPIEMYKLTYPNKVFDYMAAGRAVILAIDGVIRQVVESAGAGVFVPPGDADALAEAIRALQLDPDRCREMGIAGRRAVEVQFNRINQADMLEKVFMEINCHPQNNIL